MIKGLALLPVLLLTGCTTMTCTEIGCQDGAEIELSPPLAPGSYEIDISDSSDSAFCSVTVGTQETVDCTGRLSEVRIEAGMIFVGGTPATLSIQITAEDGIIADESIDLEYESEQPNGPGCPPVCSQAQVVLTVSTG
jgi:hypothetical protein